MNETISKPGKSEEVSLHSDYFFSFPLYGCNCGYLTSPLPRGGTNSPKDTSAPNLEGKTPRAHDQSPRLLTKRTPPQTTDQTQTNPKFSLPIDPQRRPHVSISTARLIQNHRNTQGGSKQPTRQSDDGTGGYIYSPYSKVPVVEHKYFPSKKCQGFPRGNTPPPKRCQTTTPQPHTAATGAKNKKLGQHNKISRNGRLAGTTNRDCISRFSELCSCKAKTSIFGWMRIYAV